MKIFISLVLLSVLAFSFAGCKAKIIQVESTTEKEVESVKQLNDDYEFSATVHSVFSETKSIASEIWCKEGELTPERIAAGLTGVTGLSFLSEISQDDTAKTITIKFKDNSSYVTGKAARDVDGYSFSGTQEMQEFMKASLSKSIEMNIKGYNIIFAN